MNNNKNLIDHFNNIGIDNNKIIQILSFLLSSLILMQVISFVMFCFGSKYFFLNDYINNIFLKNITFIISIFLTTSFYFGAIFETYSYKIFKIGTIFTICYLLMFYIFKPEFLFKIWFDIVMTFLFIFQFKSIKINYFETILLYILMMGLRFLEIQYRGMLSLIANDYVMNHVELFSINLNTVFLVFFYWCLKFVQQSSQK